MAGTHRDRDRDRVVFTANLVVCIVSRTNRYDLFYTYEHLADQWKHFFTRLCASFISFGHTH